MKKTTSEIWYWKKKKITRFYGGSTFRRSNKHHDTVTSMGGALFFHFSKFGVHSSYELQIFEFTRSSNGAVCPHGNFDKRPVVTVLSTIQSTASRGKAAALVCLTLEIWKCYSRRQQPDVPFALFSLLYFSGCRTTRRRVTVPQPDGAIAVSRKVDFRTQHARAGMFNVRDRVCCMDACSQLGII